MKKRYDIDTIIAAHAQGQSKESYVKKVVRIEARDNRGYTIMRNRCADEGFLVVDSSYTQAGNPSSMRNFGFPRNVVYNYEPVSDWGKNTINNPAQTTNGYLVSGGDSSSSA